MTEVDKKYNLLVKDVLANGFNYQDVSRSNIDMLEIAHHTLDIDMRKGFPLLTTKKVFWKMVAHELIWMLSGSTNIDYLKEHNVKIWDKDARNFSSGSFVGRIYGAQWRSWTSKDTKGLDQIKNTLEGIRKNIYSRRLLVTAWNPAELNDMALPPCHWAFQVMPDKDGFALKWHQRSCDTFLGIPFDIALYGFIGKLIEKETGIKFVRLIGDLSCVHFYGPHIKLIRKQMAREPKETSADFYFKNSANFDNLHIDDFVVTNYKHHNPIKAQMYAKDEDYKD